MECIPTGYRAIISGDFNFPSINWNDGIVMAGSSTDTALSANRLLKLTNNAFMNQYIRNATRGSNILDLFFCSDPFLVNTVNVTSTALSDHNMIEIIMPLAPSPTFLESSHAYDGFQNLDFSKANFDHLNHQFDQVDWDEEFQVSTVQESPIILTSILLSVCEALVPKRSKKTGKPRKLRALCRKRRKTQQKADKSQRDGQ